MVNGGKSLAKFCMMIMQFPNLYLNRFESSFPQSCSDLMPLKQKKDMSF